MKTDSYRLERIAGLRHRLVHNYEGTNWGMIGEILRTEIRPFIEAVEAIRVLEAAKAADSEG